MYIDVPKYIYHEPATLGNKSRWETTAIRHNPPDPGRRAVPGRATAQSDSPVSEKGLLIAEFIHEDSASCLTHALSRTMIGS